METLSDCAMLAYLRDVLVLAFPLGIYNFPEATNVGDTTGGGLGLPNGGELPNGWTYRFSITRTLDNNDNNYENGMPPDVTVILDPVQTAQGIDNVIETACDILLGE